MFGSYQEVDGDGELDFTHDPTQRLIDNAPEYAVRKILKQLCGSVDTARHVSLFLGNVIEAEATQLFHSDPAATHAECTGCGKDFDTFNNPIGSCAFYTYHPKHAELDYGDDFWADQDCPPPEEFSVDEYPGGFRFWCCDQKATTKGCQPFRHIAGQPASELLGEESDSDDGHGGRDEEDDDSSEGPSDEEEESDDDDPLDEEEEDSGEEEDDDDDSEAGNEIEEENDEGATSNKHEVEEDDLSDAERPAKRRKASSCMQS